MFDETEPQGQDIKQLVLDKAEEKMRRSQTYPPKDKKNVEKNYQVVKGCMEQLPDENYRNMEELISALNRLNEGESNEGVSFVGINSIVKIGEKEHEKRYKVLAIFPPGTPMFSAYRDTPGATSFIGGENLWDNSYERNKKQMFLPGVYISEAAAPLKE